MTTAITDSMLMTFILPIAQALRSHGIDALEVVESVGIDASGVINPDRRISAKSLHELLNKSVDLTEDEAFGLVAAEQLQPQVLQGLGLAWLAGDTVYDGLRRTVRFGKFMATSTELRLEETDDIVYLTMGSTLQLENIAVSASDFGVGIILRMCRLALGEFIAPVNIELSRPLPREPERWEYMLSSRVTFDCPETRLSFSRADILQPLITGNPALAQVNDEQTQAYLDGFLTQHTARDVVHKIVEKLPDGAPNQQQIAQSLNVSNRTLQRKLKEEGTSFMHLLQDTRLQLARKYLKQPSRSIVETAYLLGFSEPSTFSRAFKRWTGQAPADYRGRESHVD